MLQRKPMTALYEAVRRFLEHPQDDTGRAELEYHLGGYEAEAPGGGAGSWRPHPLNLHPPPTAESQAAFQRMLQVCMWASLFDRSNDRSNDRTIDGSEGGAWLLN